MATFYNLPAVGEKVSLHTHLAIREDAHLLFGFGTETERRAFRELIKVSGIGAKTALAVPPPIIRTNPDGTTSVEYQGAATGSGIRVLLTGDAKPGEVDLIAPRGSVNAGDAGIGSAGNINIAAQVVRGGDNIQFSGTSTGVPVAQTGSIAAGMTGVSNQAADAGKAGAEAAQSLAQQKPQESFRPSFLNVEVIGFGDAL
jgi:hypothetical protein